MWDMYMEALKFVFTPTDIEVMHLVMVGIAAKGMLSGLKWLCAFLKVEVNRTTIQVATLPVACVCLYVYCGITGCEFSLTTAQSWGQVLVSALTSIGLHEASKTSFLADVKKLMNMILDKLKKKPETPKV
jgi:hypothetical protein